MHSGRRTILGVEGEESLAVPSGVAAYAALVGVQPYRCVLRVLSASSHVDFRLFWSEAGPICNNARRLRFRGLGLMQERQSFWLR